MIWRRLLENFEPVALQRALQQVRRTHTAAGTAPDTLSDLIEGVRRILIEAKDGNLRELAFQFSPKQLRAILHLLCMPENDLVHERGEQVLNFRPRPDLLAYSWNLLRNEYPVHRLETVTKKSGTAFEWRPIARDKMEAGRFKRWFALEQLAGGILSDFSQDTDRNLNRWLDDVGIPNQSNLARGVWREIFRKSTRSLLDRLGHVEVMMRAQQEQIVLQQAFARNYLVILESRIFWNLKVLQWIRESFGVPSPTVEGLTPFWKSVPEKVRAEFRHWTIERTLREFFERIRDPHGRFEFWRQFLDHIDDARQALDWQAALIDFGSFGVVEFGETGNAAYVYPKSAFLRISSRDARYPHSLKSKSDTLRSPDPGPNGDGRIRHISHWQMRYGPWIRRLLGLRH